MHKNLTRADQINLESHDVLKGRFPIKDNQSRYVWIVNAFIKNIYFLLILSFKTLTLLSLLSCFELIVKKILYFFFFLKKKYDCQTFPTQKTASLEDELRHQSVKALVERRRNNIESCQKKKKFVFKYF